MTDEPARLGPVPLARQRLRELQWVRANLRSDDTWGAAVAAVNAAADPATVAAIDRLRPAATKKQLRPCGGEADQTRQPTATRRKRGSDGPKNQSAGTERSGGGQRRGGRPASAAGAAE